MDYEQIEKNARRRKCLRDILLGLVLCSWAVIVLFPFY